MEPPPFCSIMAGRTYLHSKIGPRMFTVRQRSSRSSSRSTTGDSQSTPALETTMSMRPKCLTVRSARFRRSSDLVTSQGMARASPPAAAIWRAVSLMVPEPYLMKGESGGGSFSVRDATTTCAPAAANASDMARPMPRLPPVTMATLPRSSPVAAIIRPLPHRPIQRSLKRPAGI